jgi:hypothetical protein
VPSVKSDSKAFSVKAIREARYTYMRFFWKGFNPEGSQEVIDTYWEELAKKEDIKIGMGFARRVEWCAEKASGRLVL